MAAVSKHLLDHKIDAAMWFCRVIALFYGLQYVFPIFSPVEVSYSKVLLSNAATSALRLHQRVGTVSFSREFLMRVLVEDSFHYLVYSMTFLPCSPITLVMMPVLLFAILHCASFSL